MRGRASQVGSSVQKAVVQRTLTTLRNPNAASQSDSDTASLLGKNGGAGLLLQFIAGLDAPLVEPCRRVRLHRALPLPAQTAFETGLPRPMEFEARALLA